ncbi:UvrD-helicase domain-containing protein [archaeon]|jgi:superfamily I DNA/RNA helicase|nr:UvrD-helicase domain-containing protein [archaeon]
MVEIISEFKRDDSMDYLKILMSLNEIPFPVGKNLLAEFLLGDMDNKSVLKNNLYDLHNFGGLEYLDKGKILEIIEKLIVNGLIDLSGSVFNKFIKVLSLSIKGKNELIEPTLNSKKVGGNYEEVETRIDKNELRAFEELNDFLKGFNLEQKKAIISSKEKILCIAGAGSGKTTVLTKRIEFLNKLNRVKGDKILAITFTRKAKQEMEKRLEKLEVRGVVVETFNSFCEKFLLKNGGRVYGKKVRVINYSEKMMALLRSLDNLGINLEDAVIKYFKSNSKKNKSFYQLQNMFLSDCFNVLDYFKSSGKKFDDFEKKSLTDDNSKMVFEIVRFLEKYLIENGFRTYGDQINDTVNFLKLYSKHIPSFEYILVDEFQDVNSQQVELLELLNSKNLFCVGDPRQAIFGWRGSNISFILDFNKKYSGCDMINLKTNYRSSKHVVDFMNKAIEGMKLTNLESSFQGIKHLKFHNFEDEKREFEFVKNEILRTNISLEEIFVLARTNRQLVEFAESLKNENIPFILKNDDNPNVEVKKNCVTLSTIHSIKGLEAELVFVIGCTQNNFPCRASEHPVIDNLKMYEYDKEEEERRLFYVAVSRARNKLILSYSGKKHSYFINNEMRSMFD